MKPRNKKYIVNAAGFDELLRKLRGTRGKAKDDTQPSKAESVPKPKPPLSYEGVVWFFGQNGIGAACLANAQGGRASAYR